VITYKNLGQSYPFETISIRLIDEQDFREVNIVKYDLDLDIAVLKLTCDRNIQPIKIGNDNKLDYGDKVYAIGNMSNYGISLTTGYIGIPHINITYNEITRNVIQCDLTISDGNSGGALIDENGKLVGITTFRLKDQANNIIYGISYCIPVNTVMEYIKI
ncbi:MAG: S1C family serine protease, partial [Clostridia bacterium]